jgi:hypothetical protein
VEASRHNAIRGVKSLLNTVAVVHVDIDVQHAGMYAEELEYAKDAE